VSRAFGAFFRDHDVLLTPTTNTTALPLGFLDHDDARVSADEWCTRFHGCFSFTPPFNLTGLPAISLPLGESSRGMPIGVQLAADMCQESILIGASAELERAMPWAGRRPRIHAARGARSRE
jgi:amidase